MTAHRSCLSVPGSRPRFYEKADLSAADMVLFDLEDSVAPAAKEEAREQVVQGLRTHGYRGKLRGVRVNSVETRWCADDVRHVVEGAGDRLDCLVVPKVDDVDAVHFMHHLLNQLEWKLSLERPIGLELQVESARGMENSARVAAASSRNRALIFGPVDLAADMRLPGFGAGETRPDYPGDLWHFFLARVAVAARASGLQAIDGPFVQVRELEGLRESARRSAALGYDGKWVLHPDQVEVVNQVFSPSQEDFDRAHRVMDAYRQATEGERTGAVLLGGEMIDEASRKLAMATLERGQAAGMSSSSG
ncbi:MAG: CoA ester lyase [Candidatus Nephthysia bennettiae]|uniref:CoA ester lyase n=1 Tax=Candidatus Nephthysia bennettiae TaxID=3127016 RepID=A0A934KD17_9BACT|nr:CoA ester lyase [Candidatus Dormibacteraeota bacterium]MBJ7612894.1 CoA ester lyase [Candidatus Dormibacteraeota bacterium]PZR86514.1 MAG: CoA ester lyase [Candidatus Dormibacteraeota bacterium]